LVFLLVSAAIDAMTLPAVEAPPYDEARIAAWANETHALGIRAYQLLPAGSPDHNTPEHPITIGNDYPTAIKADLDQQLLRGAAGLEHRGGCLPGEASGGAPEKIRIPDGRSASRHSKGDPVTPHLAELEFPSKRLSLQR
jgi:hypothetical protein